MDSPELRNIDQPAIRQNKIGISPVHQTGHNCKTVAIAAVDKYFGRKIGFEPIPLHKNKKNPISIREIAKTKRSIQGELLEIIQVENIFADIGYKTKLLSFKDNFSLFKETIIQNIQSGNLIMAYFAIDRDSKNPTTILDKNKSNEHAAIIHGFDEKSGIIYILHNDKTRTTTFEKLYKSSMILPKQRNPEYYQKIANREKNIL